MFFLQIIFGFGKQFYILLDEVVQVVQDSVKVLYVMLCVVDCQFVLDVFKLVCLCECVVLDKISQVLVDSFMILIECEDIEVLGLVLYKIFKQIEKFVDCYLLVIIYLEYIDFVLCVVMFEQVVSVVVEMVNDLCYMNLDWMIVFNEKL